MTQTPNHVVAKHIGMNSNANKRRPSTRLEVRIILRAFRDLESRPRPHVRTDSNKTTERLEEL